MEGSARTHAPEHHLTKLEGEEIRQEAIPSHIISQFGVDFLAIEGQEIASLLIKHVEDSHATRPQ